MHLPREFQLLSHLSLLSIPRARFATKDRQSRCFLTIVSARKAVLRKCCSSAFSVVGGFIVMFRPQTLVLSSSTTTPVLCCEDQHSTSSAHQNLLRCYCIYLVCQETLHFVRPSFQLILSRPQPNGRSMSCGIPV
jgi:hypothetical protein